jgi:hypothetical protein
MEMINIDVARSTFVRPQFSHDSHSSVIHLCQQLGTQSISIISLDSMALTLRHIQIGWISALPIEALLAEIMLDELIEQAIALPPNDNNIYTYGRINIAGTTASHIVAIAQFSLSTTGKASAATVAKDMRRTFPNLKFGIVVGIAGGVWTDEVDVRLGDVVVGVPDHGGPGVVQYDHGKAVQEREFVVKGSLNKAPDLLRTAAGLLKRKHMRRPGQYVSTMDNEEVKHHAPRPNEDNLFFATYVHQQGKNCEGCDSTQLRDRPHRTDLAIKFATDFQNKFVLSGSS